MRSLLLILKKPVYFAPAWVFTSINILIGTWVLYIPQIKHKFLLNDAELGFALFFNAFGLLLGITLVPFINKKIGAGFSTKIGITFLCITFNLLMLAPSYLFFCLHWSTMGEYHFWHPTLHPWCQDWSAWCQYSVTGWDIRPVLHSISLYGSRHSIV